MKHSVKLLTGLVCAACLLSGCAEQGGRALGVWNDYETLGGPQDAFGCYTSAGYTYSRVLKRCTRIFESGNLLEDPGLKNKTQGSYVVFSQDYSQAELFLPYRGTHDILTRQGDIWTDGYFTVLQRKTMTGRGYVWRLESKDGQYMKP